MRFTIFNVVIILLILTFSISLLIYKKDIKHFNKQLLSKTVNSKDINVNGCKVQYEVQGEGTPILVLHGITGGIDQGKGMVNTYLSTSYKYIYVSRFGYLNSEMTDEASVEKQAEVYKQLLDSLNIEKVYLYANSAGGTSAIQFAMKYPNRVHGLILQSSNMPGQYAKLPPKQVMQVVFGNNYVYWLSIKLFGNSMLKSFMTSDLYESLDSAKKRDLLNNVFLSSLPISKRKQGIIFDMFTSNAYINQLTINSNVLKMPVLILHAHDDPSIPIEYAHSFASRLSNCELVAVSGGHLMINSETVVKNSIDKFINEYTD